MTIEQLIETYPYNVRRKVFMSLSRLLEKVEGDTDGAKINRVEKDMTRFTVKVWNKRATKAVNNAVNGITGSPTAKFTKKDEAKVFRAIEKAFKTIQDEVTPKIKRSTNTIFHTSQNKFEKQNNLKGSIFKFDWFQQPIENEMFGHSVLKIVPTEKAIEKVGEELAAIAVSFDVEATAIVDQMSKIHAVSIGDHFASNLKPTITNSIKRGVFDKGLNKVQAGEFLKKELRRKLGGKAFQTSVPPGIRAQGIKAVNAYHEGLSATNVTLTRNMANIQSLNDAGVTQAQFVAVIDNRTSQICQQMDGRIFELSQLNGYANQVMAAENVEDLKEFGKWQRDLSSFGLKAGEKLSDADTSARLARAGVLVPPLHMRCRSEIQIA